MSTTVTTPTGSGAGKQQAAIDLSNRQLVAATTDGTIVFGSPYLSYLTPDQALVLAAWIVATAQAHTTNTFATIQTAVNNS